MNILIISQNYPPDLGAASFRMHALASALAARGHSVHVVTAMPNRYSEYTIAEDIAEYEVTDCATVYRVSLSAVGNSKIRRVGGYFQFLANALKLLPALNRKNIHVVIATTPQILQAVVGWQFAGYLNAKLVLDVRDLWPETAIALGEILPNGVTANLLRRVEKMAYVKADHIVTTSPGYVDHISQTCNGRTPVDVVMNGIDDMFLDNRPESNTNKSMHAGKQVKVLYAGNIGYCQNLTTLVEAAAILRSDPIEFELVGSGTHMVQVTDMVDSYALSNVRILKPIRRDKLMEKYVEADILYLQLFATEYFARTIPSKIFDYLPLGKPVIYGLNGCAKAILEKFPGTFYVRPDDPVYLARVIREVAQKGHARSIWPRDVNELRQFSRKQQTRKFVKVVEMQLGDDVI